MKEAASSWTWRCNYNRLLVISLCLIRCCLPAEGSGGSIIFATLGGSDYAFDIFTLPATDPPRLPLTNADELRITDGHSINFNGHFLSSPFVRSPLLSLPPPEPNSNNRHPHLQVVYVTERNGSSYIFLDDVYFGSTRGGRRGRRSAMEEEAAAVPDLRRVQVPLLGPEQSRGRVSMKDKPSLAGEHLVYVSTHENTGVPRTSWAAVYSTHLPTGSTRRLTPYGVADFSPAVSPSGGTWTAVASYGEKGWQGDVEELETDIYVFRTRDGSGRVKVVQHGGWPSWADKSTLYFHRRGDDGWWSVYRAFIPFLQAADDGDDHPNPDCSAATATATATRVERVTPPGLHAFTPAASLGNKGFIAVATRRPDSDFRHIELFDLRSNQFRDLTRPVSPRTHHFNPFISPDSTWVGYHRCRGDSNGGLFLENLRTPSPEVPLFRIDGSFPSFSPAGDRIAFVHFPGVYVANRDGSNRRQVLPTSAFSTAWDPVRKGVVYTSTGPTFATESTEVDVVAIDVDDDEEGPGRYKKLSVGGQNNAFPSPSPDGKWLVFRSGRSGHKNLYVMDAIQGEQGVLRQLTRGPWTDTMCNWSPDGDWIAFASDRANPGGGSFELYAIHPNGTGLRKVFQSGSGGRANHPVFSPDGKQIVFTSDYAGVSAEPISNPHHYQPYGEIFTVNLDGSNPLRLTHNSFEDGTPAWGPTFIRPADVEQQHGGATEPQCSFEDCHWLSETPNLIRGRGAEGAPSRSGGGSARIQCARLYMGPISPSQPANE